MTDELPKERTGEIGHVETFAVRIICYGDPDKIGEKMARRLAKAIHHSVSPNFAVRRWTAGPAIAKDVSDREHWIDVEYDPIKDDGNEPEESSTAWDVVEAKRKAGSPAQGVGAPDYRELPSSGKRRRTPVDPGPLLAENETLKAWREAMFGG